MDGNSQFDWTFDVPGRHTVTFAVDVDNHVAESDENNNSHSLALTVGGRGRLRPACPPLATRPDLVLHGRAAL
jgi:subtilase family serine protease